MRSALVVAVAFVAATLLILAGPSLTAESPAPAATAAPTDAPRIAVEPPSFDFGKTLPQKAVTREFSIRNFGGQDLVIESVTTSCGCTAALLDPAKKVLKAGGNAPLRVTLTTPAGPGRITKSVLVKSNDPARATLEIKVMATVVAEGAGS